MSLVSIGHFSSNIGHILVAGQESPKKYLAQFAAKKIWHNLLQKIFGTFCCKKYLAQEHICCSRVDPINKLAKWLSILARVGGGECSFSKNREKIIQW